MLPSGSTRPDQPTANVSKLPASARLRDVTNSVGCQRDVDPDRLLHRLDHLPEPCGDRVGGDRQRHLGVRDPRRLDELLRRRHVGVEVALQAFRGRVPGADRRDRVAVGKVQSAEHDAVDRRPVERQVERRTQILRLRQRRADVRVRLEQAVLVPDVDRDPLVPDRRGLDHGDRALRLLERRDVGRLHAVLDLDVARPQVLGAGARIGQDLEHDRGQVHVGLAVVEVRLRRA